MAMERFIVKIFSLLCFLFRFLFKSFVDLLRFCYGRKFLVLNILRKLWKQGRPRHQYKDISVSQLSPFTNLETVPFGWLPSVAPCFPVDSRNVSILSEPGEFYAVVKKGCATARTRLVLASLYWGTGTLEKDIVKTILDNEGFRNGSLSVDILLDYLRGSRFADNSRKVLRPLLMQGCKCRVSLYHTPFLRGLMKKLLPHRWNELCGVQHMKLHIFDDELVISGANLSNDYYTNRQDRYFVIRDKNLCNFYCGLVKIVQEFSLEMDEFDNVSLEVVKIDGDLVNSYIQKAIDESRRHCRVADTWVFPLIQMGQLGIHQDSETTDQILSKAPKNSTLCIATGYFNLTSQYTSTLIKKTKAACRILMAHPKCNSFWEAKGLAGGIPYAYSLIARKFQKEFENCGQGHRLNLVEYLRDDWSYHGKGLWYYPPESEYPCFTLIGSSNFGERSVGRDLEAQLAVVTESSELRKKFHEECQKLYKFGTKAETEREVPKWVHVLVVFFRNYF